MCGIRWMKTSAMLLLVLLLPLLRASGKAGVEQNVQDQRFFSPPLSPFSLRLFSAVCSHPQQQSCTNMATPSP